MLDAMMEGDDGGHVGSVVLGVVAVDFAVVVSGVSAGIIEIVVVSVVVIVIVVFLKGVVAVGVDSVD